MIGKCAAAQSAADRELTRSFVRGEHGEFCRRGAHTYMGAVHRTNLAYFSEICVNVGINWGIVTYHDV